jgi:hypothetical protein
VITPVDRAAKTQTLFLHSFRLGLLILVDLGFGFWYHRRGGDDEVISNKVSLASTHLDDVRSGVDKGSIKFDVSDLLILFGSWHLMCLSEEAAEWLSRCGNLVLFNWYALQQGLTSSTLYFDGK